MNTWSSGGQNVPFVNFLQQAKASGDIQTRKSSSQEAAGLAMWLVSGTKDAFAICKEKNYISVHDVK